MGAADEQIRVTDRVKRELDRRRRDGESYNDVLERLVGGVEGDFEEGFGRWSDAHAERVRTERDRAKQQRKRRSRPSTDDT